MVMKELPKTLHLVNLYDGDVQAVFDDADQLVDYLKRKDKAGSLMGEAAFTIFWGAHLSTRSFWKSAFEQVEEHEEVQHGDESSNKE